MLNAATHAAIRAAIIAAAVANHLEPSLVEAVVLAESGGDPALITPNPWLQRHLVGNMSMGLDPLNAALESADLGLMQINPSQALRNQWAPLSWKRMQACDLLIPELNLSIGCKMWRWWLYKSLGVLDIAAPMTPDGRPDYEAIGRLMQAMTPEARAGVYLRAACAYTWPASLTNWNGTPRAKRIYAERVVKLWERLREGSNDGN
jgi:hypothetical protein